jgi:hypothetical protein
MTLGSKEVADIGRVQQGLDKFGHGCLVSELRCIAFYGPQTGIIDYAMGQRGLSDTWWAIEENGGWITGCRATGPFDERVVVLTV